MKFVGVKYTVVMILLLSGGMVYAQFQKGDKFLGGSFSYQTQYAPNSLNGSLINESLSISASPQLGFLISDRLAIGGQIGYTYSHTKRTTSTPIEETFRYGFTAGAFVKKYYLISDKFLFSLNTLIQYNRGKEHDVLTGTTTTNEYTLQDYQLGISVQPFLLFFPSPNWGFECGIGSVGYTYSHSLSYENTSNTLSLNYGTVSLGLAYYFRK